MAQQDDDKQVVASVLAGDRQRFALLVQRYHGPLLHLAQSRLGNQDAAEDAVQDAFICAFRSLHTYKSEFSFRTWLWSILLNQCRRHGARNAKQPTQATQDPNSEQPEDLSPELSAMLTERSLLLGRLLQQLPQPQADAIRLRFYGQLKYREIADAMGSSLGAAKQRVRHGLIAMGEMLREQKLIDSVFPEE